MDRAVGDKYNPIEEEINVKLANLDLILTSPRFTQSEKDQAQEQKDTQEKKKSEIQEQKVEQKAIWDISVNAAQANASSTVLRNIQDAQTKEEALRIATEAGVFVEKVPTVGLAKDFFTNTQLSIGAAKAGMGVTEFGNLSVDEANRFIRDVEEEVPTFEEFLAEAQEEARQTFTQETRDELRRIYDEEVAKLGDTTRFSDTELKKLEQAGLLDATRQKQLDFLFGEKGKTTGRTP